MDTLAFGYILPTTGRIRDFNPLETCAAGRTKKNAPADREICHAGAFFLNADKHSPASSVRSTKRRVRGMLLLVGVESSH